MENELNEILNKLQPYQVWDLTGQGLVYMKGEGDELKLLATFNSMDAAKVHGVIKGEVEKRGWVLDESEARVIGDPDEQFEFSLGLKQQQLESMQCPNPECSLPIAAYGFDQASWRFLGEQEGTDDEGKVLSYEDWGVEVPCSVCEHQILLPPRDFELLVGTDFLENYRTEVVTYRVVHPPEAAEIVDARDEELGRMVVLGSVCGISGERLPIHLRGRPAIYEWNEEEE